MLLLDHHLLHPLHGSSTGSSLLLHPLVIRRSQRGQLVAVALLVGPDLVRQVAVLQRQLIQLFLQFGRDAAHF